MVKSLFIFTVLLVFTGCASAEKMPDGDSIPFGANTIVLATNKTAKSFYKDLKRRALQKGFYFKQIDQDTNSFVTDFYDVHKRSSVQLRVYVKNVPGGSNAIVSGKFMDLKKLKRYPWHRPESISYRKKGKASKKAWKSFYNYGVGSQKWKYTLLKR